MHLADHGLPDQERSRGFGRFFFFSDFRDVVIGLIMVLLSGIDRVDVWTMSPDCVCYLRQRMLKMVMKSDGCCDEIS